LGERGEEEVEKENEIELNSIYHMEKWVNLAI
jgi:hypothetical protein